jgi:hypothetical protein
MDALTVMAGRELEIKTRSERVLSGRGLLSRLLQELPGPAQGRPAGPAAFGFGCSIWV